MIMTKIQAVMRHGAPMCPSPLCMFFTPLGRLAKMMGLLQLEVAVKPTVPQILKICMDAWDHKSGEYSFQVLVVNRHQNNQAVYIRAEPGSAYKFSINPDGSKFPAKEAGGKANTGWGQKPKSTGEWGGSAPQLKDPWASSGDSWANYKPWHQWHKSNQK
jgi:hypothetical protein